MPKMLSPDLSEALGGESDAITLVSDRGSPELWSNFWEEEYSWFALDNDAIPDEMGKSDSKAMQTIYQAVLDRFKEMGVAPPSDKDVAEWIMKNPNTPDGQPRSAPEWFQQYWFKPSAPTETFNPRRRKS